MTKSESPPEMAVEKAPPEQQEPQQQEMEGEVIRLAEENRRLSAENRRLREEKSSAEVGRFMERLRSEGRLTPALERSGVEQALLAAEERQINVDFPDGSSTGLAAVLRELLSALPVSFGYGELAAGDEAESSGAAALSADELSIASQLGLSAEEYSAIKNSPG